MRTYKETASKLISFYSAVRIDTLIFYASLTLFLSSTVITRSPNYIFFAISIITGIYKTFSGCRVKQRDVAIIISILGGAYITYKTYNMGELSVILGVIICAIFITIFDLINSNERTERPQR